MAGYFSRRASLLSGKDVTLLRSLHERCFSDTAPMPEFDYASDKGAWWLMFASGETTPVAFAGIVPSTYGPGFAYHKRAGVVQAHRGSGLQRRLIHLRERWARKHKFHTIVTDTCETCASSNNLIRCGYTLFEPPVPWGLSGSLYFRKKLV